MHFLKDNHLNQCPANHFHLVIRNRMARIHKRSCISQRSDEKSAIQLRWPKLKRFEGLLRWLPPFNLRMHLSGFAVEFDHIIIINAWVYVMSSSAAVCPIEAGRVIIDRDWNECECWVNFQFQWWRTVSAVHATIAQTTPTQPNQETSSFLALFILIASDSINLCANDLERTHDSIIRLEFIATRVLLIIES